MFRMIENPGNPEGAGEHMKKWVDIVEFDASTGAHHTRARCILEDGRVRIEGDEEYVKGLNEGIKYPPEGKVFTSADGEDFLKAVTREYHSIYLFATDIQEGAELKPFELPPAEKVEDKKE